MDKITISRKTMEAAGVFERLVQGDITQREAAERLECTIRWIRTLLRRYRAGGAQGLQHRNSGRPSTRKIPIAHEEAAVALYREKLEGSGPTFLAEKLAQLQGIKISEESMRIIMIKYGIWRVSQSRPKHRKWRLRRAQVGLMIQLDGSPHDWFEGRGPWCTLLVFIDDATSRIVWLEFAPSESTFAVLRATKNYLMAHGRPIEMYVDHGSAWHVNLNNKEHDKLTQWERALKELNIKVTHAHSPQAKGRVERVNKTLQDRLVKEMRLAGISSIDAANRFVQGIYLPDHNKRFAQEPADSIDAHRSLEGYDLDAIMTVQEQRTVQANYVIQHAKQLYQLAKQQPVIVRPRDTVTVVTHLDRTVSLKLRGKPLAFQSITQRPPKPTTPAIVAQVPHKPAHQHPWRRYPACASAKPTPPSARTHAVAVGTIPSGGNRGDATLLVP